MDGMMGMGWWMALWGIVGLVVLALAVLGVVWLARGLPGKPGKSESAGDRAEEEVRQLYAAGHIDREEYLRRLDDLRRR